MPVRTARLARGRTGAAGADVVAYTASPGETVILKDVRMSNTVGAQIALSFLARSGAIDVQIVSRFIPALETASLTPWVVLLPGDELIFRCDTANALTYWLSGTELEGLAD